MKRRFLITLFALLVTSPLIPQSIDFSGKEWEDPSVFEINQNRPHAFHAPYQNTQQAITGNESENESVQSLNGTWKFRLFERPDLVPEEFHTSKFDTRKWDDICVPSNWQMLGYGDPKFRNIALTFESNPPLIPDYYNPTGCYSKRFNIPSEWSDKEIMLRFEGIKSAAYIWINGKAVGYNQGGFEPAEFNITPFVKKGKNDIAIKVLRFCDGSYLENQDMWRLSGIFRDVKLYAMPKVYIHDFFHFTDLDAEYNDAVLHTELDIRNALTTSISDYSIMVDVTDATGKSILKTNGIKSAFDASAGELVKLQFEADVPSPEKWSAEFPNLYDIQYSLFNNHGDLLETFSKKLGFREVEIREEVFCLNGVPIKLNGVNSHMHHPEHGQAVPVSTLKEDLLIMKKHNINAVRTCHYPPSPEYLELADELGMYIIDEVGDEAHQNIFLSDEATYTEMYRDRSRKLVHRDRNHASVIIWSAGNESGSGTNIKEVIEVGKSIDPTRPGWMYGGNTFYIPFEDITGPRYWIPYQLKNLAEGKILDKGDLRPAFMDEYLAATGNGLGGMDEYWEVIRSHPRVLGGAIWDYISPGIYTPLWITDDASPEKNHGVIMGRPTFKDTDNGRALVLTGHDQWVEFYRDSSLDVTEKELTIACRFKPSKIPQENYILMKGDHQYGLYIDKEDNLVFYVQSNSIKRTNQFYNVPNESVNHKVNWKLPANWYDTWHEIRAEYNGETMSLHVDGKLEASASNDNPIAHSPFPLCIGRNAETQDQGEHSGRLSAFEIDQLEIFNKAISGNTDEGIEPILKLNFETDSREGEFFSVGLGGRTYGMVWPDRKIQPELRQVKKSGQPVHIEMIDQGKQVYKVTNYHHFKNLRDYRTQWHLMEDGIVKDSGDLKLDIAPGASKEIKIPYTTLKTPGEIILTITFDLKSDEKWAAAEFEVAWEQFVIQEPLRIPDLATKGKVSVVHGEDALVVRGENFEYTIDPGTGIFKELNFAGTRLAEDGLLFNIWRAPLANDIDPWGSQLFHKENITPGLGRSIDNQLRTLGMRNLNLQLQEIQVLQPDDSHAKISMVKYYHSENMRGAFKCNETYEINGEGIIEVSLQVEPQGFMPDLLPRIGWQIQIPKSFDAVKWYGRGSFETYPDRKTGAKIGIHESDPDQEYTPYIIPQDYGNHTDIRWVQLEGASSHGFRVSGDVLFNFSYHKYTTENLSRSMYTYQLKEADYNTLSIDMDVTGVGGTAVRQLEKYKVRPGVRSFSMIIEPF